jgi:6-phosphofructokinase 1
MEKKKFKRIGVLTSGGDAPGMNAAIRAVVRTCIFHGVEPVGIMRGYQGILDKRFFDMQSHSVSKIINLGGTMLKSSRCPQFKEKEIRKQAIENLKEKGIEALIVIGGDGSFRGADALYTEFGFPVVGVPGTIDNDIYGTDFTIGFDTAINTAVEAIDKIRDTADSHNLLFFVEVMGRDAGFIGLYTGIATGAEQCLLPEYHTDINKLCNYIINDRRKNKTSGIIVVAEGDDAGSAIEIAAKVKEKLPDYDTRVTTLGHIQRGGSPTCNDRVLASLLGNGAVEALLEGHSGIMIGQINGKVAYTPLAQAYTEHNMIDRNLYEMARILAL